MLVKIAVLLGILTAAGVVAVALQPAPPPAAEGPPPPALGRATLDHQGQPSALLPDEARVEVTH